MADAGWAAGVVIVVLGMAEAGLVGRRRRFVINPGTTLDTRMPVSLYGHLQDLTVSLHDRWGSGQVLSRAMTDLNFLRRWMAFGAIMLVVTTLTVVIGVVVMGGLRRFLRSSRSRPRFIGCLRMSLC